MQNHQIYYLPGPPAIPSIRHHNCIVAEFANCLSNSLLNESQLGPLTLLNPKIDVLWTIPNFSNLIDKNGQFVTQPLHSPIVITGVHGAYALSLSLYLGDQSQNDNGYTSVCLHATNIHTKKDVKVKYQIDIVDSNNIIFHSSNTSGIISMPCGVPNRFPKFIKRIDIINPANNVLLNNQLRIRCTVEIYDTPSHNFIQFENRLGVSESLRQLYQDDTFSDVTFIVSNQNFKAHRNILAARSSVFRAMLTTDMTEKKTNEVIIDDIKPDIFEKLLFFIYSGTVDFNVQTAHDLLIAADKYDINDLKNLCEVKISLAISVKNVIDVLILADRHNVVNLKKQALNFISDHADVVVTTQRYKTWSKSGDLLLGEAFQVLAKRIVS